MNDEPSVAALVEENRSLRARLTTLEEERQEQTRRSLEAVAAARARAYWLDRWRVDLDAVMDRPSSRRALTVARRGRRLLRHVKGLRSG